MEYHIDKTVALPNVTVQLGTANWEGTEETQPYSGYNLSQRLSENHSALRIGNLAAPAVLPRVRSIGLLPPGRPIRLLPVETPLRVLLCTFDEAFFESTTEVSRGTWEEHTDSVVSISNKRLEVMMQEIYAEVEQPGFGQETFIDAVTTIMLIELGRHARRLEQKSAGDSRKIVLAPWQMRRIEERIQASLEIGYPSLSELAEICGISQSHLTRTFKASTGWQIHQYIANERVKAAKSLLAGKELSCKEVSSLLGFKSPAYFSTAFRRVTGKTPSDYQKQARAKTTITR